MSIKQGLFAGFLFAFLVLGFVSMKRAIPAAKEDRIYNAIHLYSPYSIEKRIGGLTIIDSRTGDKEKLSAAEFYHRLDEVEKEWGKEHLKIVDNDVLVLGENNQTVSKIYMETDKEKQFVRSFYGI